MLGTTIRTGLDLIFIQCNGNGESCGGVYAVNREWYDNRRKYGGAWHCPYCGTSWVASENELNKAKRELVESQKKEAAALAEANHFRLSRDRLLSRANKGVCQHCNRYFKNVHKHVESKHKDKLKQESEVGGGDKG